MNRSRFDSGPSQSVSRATQTRLLSESFRINFDSQRPREYFRDSETLSHLGIVSGMASAAFCLYVVGHLHGITRRRLALAVGAAGGRLVGKAISRVDLVALGYGSALVALIDAPPIALPDGIPPGAEVISELRLKRHLGLVPSPLPEHHQLSQDDLSRSSGLD
jgi:hypothetical protein